MSAFIVPAVARARKLERDREAEIGDERERMRRVDRERREQRKDLAQEMILEPGSFPSWSHPGRRPARCPARTASCAVRASASADRLPAPRPPRRCARVARPGSGRPGSWSAMPSRTWPLQARHAHHEEFVEIVGRDREKAHPLQQRMGLVGGLLEHPAIEMQPRQLAVDEALRARAQIRGLLPARVRSSPPLGRGGFFFQNSCLAAIRHGRNGLDSGFQNVGH